MKKQNSVLLLYSFACVLVSIRCDSSSTHSDNPSSLGDSSPQTGNQPNLETEDRQPFLRLIDELKNQNLVSGGKALFRCRVEGWPDDKMRFTWYKDNEKFDANESSRFSIREKATSSRLIIKVLYTSDAGLYRCEVSNGIQRVHTSARLKVAFERPPLDEIETKIPEGKCETYSGKACKSQLSGSSVYIDPFLTQAQMEQQITAALSHITNTDYVSEQCERYAYPAFCNFVFAPCEQGTDSTTGNKKAIPIKLCREDCELMKYTVCSKDYLNSGGDAFLQDIFNTANCSRLPPTTSNKLKCTKVGLPSVSNQDHNCYNDTGASYKGLASTTQSGKQCKPWPRDMMKKHAELAGGHNFCRNLGHQMNKPWCFIDENYINKEECDLRKCGRDVPVASGTDMFVVLIPSIAVPFVIGCIIAVFCVCRRKNTRSTQKQNGNTKPTIGNKLDMQHVLSTRKAKVPELNATSVHLLVEIGDGAYGKVYKAKVFSNPQFSTNYPVAVKRLRESSLPLQVDEFQREIEVFSELQHENVACLKAVVTEASLRCMIFEYTDSVDLHEYLVSHSPQSDFAKPISSASSHDSSVIELGDFVKMAIQITSGMEYLSSNNYIHRDLAARNVLVCGNMDLKICNLGVVRDSYLSSYYRSPQGGQMLPIRWMAPESLLSWKFSDKSAVWSFGVLLWEMFSYGLQPYCGYSNHEVLDMISRRQLLTCPDKCPAKMYSLMHECWSGAPSQRPQFGDLRAKLQGWSGSNTGRVTSQLAQGIHRQLTNVLRDGSGQYNQYYQASSIGGSSGVSYNPGIPTAPSPPPQYQNEYVPLPTSSSSTYHSQQQHHISSNVSPSSQQQFSSGIASNSFPAYNSQGFQQTKYNSNFGSSSQHQDGQMVPKRGPPFAPGPASHSSRSSSSCASSSKDQYHPGKSHRQTNGDTSYLEEFHPPPFSGPGNRSLGGVREDSNFDDDNEQYYQQPKRLHSHQQNPQLVVKTHPVSEEPLSDSSLKPMQNYENVHEADSDRSATSARAISCDSGLPVEDVDGQGLDPKAPLMGKAPRPGVKTSLRSSTTKQFT